MNAYQISVSDVVVWDTLFLLAMVFAIHRRRKWALGCQWVFLDVSLQIDSEIKALMEGVADIWKEEINSKL